MNELKKRGAIGKMQVTAASVVQKQGTALGPII